MSPSAQVRLLGAALVIEGLLSGAFAYYVRAVAAPYRIFVLMGGWCSLLTWFLVIVGLAANLPALHRTFRFVACGVTIALLLTLIEPTSWLFIDPARRDKIRRWEAEAREREKQVKAPDPQAIEKDRAKWAVIRAEGQHFVAACLGEDGLFNEAEAEALQRCGEDMVKAGAGKPYVEAEWRATKLSCYERAGYHLTPEQNRRASACGAAFRARR